MAYYISTIDPVDGSVAPIARVVKRLGDAKAYGGRSGVCGIQKPQRLHREVALQNLRVTGWEAEARDQT